MKYYIKVICLVFSISVIISCSNDDKDVVPTRFEYEFATETAIPDNGNVRLITINVEADRVVINPSKVFLEITLNHPVASDLSYGYLMPNDGDEFKNIVNNLGGLNAYNSANSLLFSPTAVETINPSIDYIYPNFVISAGIYKEGTASPDYPVESPLFQSMMNKNIRGDWKFFFLDTQELNEGSIIKVKLIFEEGALNDT